MGKLREDGGGSENSRFRSKRSRRYSFIMVLLVFIVLVAVTTLLSVQIPMRVKLNYSEEENLYELSKSFSTHNAFKFSEMEPKVMNPYTPVHPDLKRLSGWSSDWLPGAIRSETFHCERSHIRSDVCRIHGNVHLVGNASFILEAADEKTPVGEEKIRPYTRKWEQQTMDEVGELTLTSEGPETASKSNRSCDVWHHVPAVVFSTGGYTGNVYHEFNDGLIPLYTTSQHLKGEVVFVIVDYHSWWMIRYQEVLKQLSKYEIIDLANYTKSHCFVDVTVGLFIHEEMGIDQSLMPNHESIKDFRALLSQAYPLENSGWEDEFETFDSSIIPEGSTAVPQLVIIVREGSRAIMNLDELVRSATRIGYDVTILKPDPTTEMKKIFWLLDSCDVLIGVHGAALTHFLFLRPGSVFIQVVPLGTDWAARTYFGRPAKELGLKYIEYDIGIEESSLSKEYEKTDPVLANPDEVVQRGWAVVKDIYLGKQNVELSVVRFSQILQEAKSKWKGFRRKKTASVGKRSRRKHRKRP